MRALAVACNGRLLDHRAMVVRYLWLALIVRTTVKVVSFLAVSVLLWNGVPGTEFDGIPWWLAIILSILVGAISVPIFIVGIYQDIEIANRFGNSLAQRAAVLDEVNVR